MAGPGSRDGDESCELRLGPQARSGRRGRASVRVAEPTPRGGGWGTGVGGDLRGRTPVRSPRGSLERPGSPLASLIQPLPVSTVDSSFPANACTLPKGDPFPGRGEKEERDWDSSLCARDKGTTPRPAWDTTRGWAEEQGVSSFSLWQSSGKDGAWVKP